jgi:hypothetical protein
MRGTVAALERETEALQAQCRALAADKERLLTDVHAAGDAAQNLAAHNASDAAAARAREAAARDEATASARLLLDLEAQQRRTAADLTAAMRERDELAHTVAVLKSEAMREAQTREAVTRQDREAYENEIRLLVRAGVAAEALL